MEFHTLLFLFRWLPVVLLLYLLYFRTHAREAFLLVVSLLFYAWGEPLYVFLLIALGAAHYLLARRMSDERWRWLLLPAVIADVFLLVYFKYYGTILDQLSSFFSLSYEVMPMPSGISFFMFSLLSYLADVGRGKIEPERSLCRFLLYVSFFPKLLMGPIMRYADFRIQLERPYAQRDQMNKGICLFIAGLAQKVILSAWMADLFARMGQLPLSFVSGWGQAVAYSLQLYFDFAGYSLMAFGLAAMFGFYVPVNFRYPYLSDSISAFWRRWHITLGAWFRDYVYIPLGGSRRGKKRMVISLLAVWLLTGLWHGITLPFLFWGLYHGVIVLVERFSVKWRMKLPRWGRIAITDLLAVIGWVFFFSPDLASAFALLGSMFDLTSIDVSLAGWVFANYGAMLAICLIGCTPLIHRANAALSARFSWFVWVKPFVYTALMILCIAFIIGSSYQSFLYRAF